MVLTIDIGNSYITIGGYKKDKMAFVFDIVSDKRLTTYQYMSEIKNMTELFSENFSCPDGAIIGSVVPELTPIISEAISRLYSITPLVLGPGVKSGLNIRIENPAQLGADIVAGAVSALSVASAPCIICSLGTATTISVINEQELFTGVIIAAGVGTTLEGFTKSTALLPHANIDAPKNLIGKNSVQSIQSGLIYGTAAMLDGLCIRIEEELGTSADIIATGKMCRNVIPFCRTNIKVYENLVLDGLKIIYDKNC